MMTKGLNITQWAEEDRPREKMMAQGARVLSDAELLAILIGSGNTEESAVELMRRLLADCGNSLNTLGKLGVEELCAYKGMGTAKAVTLMAAFELGKRRMLAGVAERAVLRSSEEIYQLMLPRMQDLLHEECWVLLVNAALRVTGIRCVSRGGLNGTAVDVRTVLREALQGRASGLALCHNHPSGNPRPSPEDDALTKRLKAAAEVMNLRLLDHVIVTDGAYFSYMDENRL